MTDELTAVDIEALQRAVALIPKLAPEHRQRFKDIDRLRGAEWVEEAEFAAYICQTRTLRLRPWDSPPVHADSPTAARLADRLEAAGLSIFEPDPIRALAKAEGKANG